MEILEKEHPVLSITQQCILLGLVRSNLYYQPCAESEENLLIMQFLDEQYFKTPFYGVKKLTGLLRKEGFTINIKRVRRLMKKINWRTIYQTPNTSLGNKAHTIYPYLLRDKIITKANEVWCTDITYISMQRGFMYLCAIIDVHTRFIVGWSISNTMTTEWCLEVVKDAVKTHGLPEILNTDQGSQFTSHAYTNYLKSMNIKISMDGKGRAIDNIWIERFWRSIKYENIYLSHYNSVENLNEGLQKYFIFYNEERLHENLDYKTPNENYKKLNIKQAA